MFILFYFFVLCCCLFRYLIGSCEEANSRWYSKSKNYFKLWSRRKERLKYIFYFFLFCIALWNKMIILKVSPLSPRVGDGWTSFHIVTKCLSEIKLILFHVCKVLSNEWQYMILYYPGWIIWGRINFLLETGERKLWKKIFALKLKGGN
jgi:hypothetical protein